MLVDIKCLSKDPFYYANPTPNDPLFIQSTPNDPLFHFCIKFYIKIANFCALRAHFEKFNNFEAILTENLQILPWNCIFAHWMTPIFGSPHQKSPHFLVPTPNDPLFSTKSYTECPLFSFSGRHLYVTFIFECPPPRDNLHLQCWQDLHPYCTNHRRRFRGMVGMGIYALQHLTRGDGLCNHPLILWKVYNILTYLFKCSDEINRFCSKNGLFLMILTTFYQKFSPKMQYLVHQAQRTVVFTYRLF